MRSRYPGIADRCRIARPPAAGPWIGIAGMPMLLLIATLTALVAAGGLQLAGRDMTRQTSLPFGPFLAIGLLLTFVSQQFLGAL